MMERTLLVGRPRVAFGARRRARRAQPQDLANDLRVDLRAFVDRRVGGVHFPEVPPVAFQVGVGEDAPEPGRRPERLAPAVVRLVDVDRAHDVGGHLQRRHGVHRHQQVDRHIRGAKGLRGPDDVVAAERMPHEHDRPRVLARRALLDEHVGDLRPSRMVDDHRVDADSPQLVGEVVHPVGPDVPQAAQKIDARRLRRSPALPPGLSGFLPPRSAGRLA